MKPFKLIVSLAGVLILATLVVDQFYGSEPSTSHRGSVFPSEASEGTIDNPNARHEYDWLSLHDPATMEIPKGIAGRELAFARQLAQQTDLQPVSAADDWIARGPNNIGGRTRALAIDITNEDVILAGGTSSGMFKSTDGGSSWTKTTAPNQLHSVTSLVQNRATGGEQIWYYGTGIRGPEGVFSSAQSAVGNGYYRGDGIFKSVDGGNSWQQLESTVSGTPDRTDAFDFVGNLTTFGDDGLLAATGEGVFRSVDGGASWTPSLAFSADDLFRDRRTFPNSEVAVTRDGTLYATMAGGGPTNGIYRSTDTGEAWENISPPNWPDSTGRTVIGPAPSNPNLVYFFSELGDPQQQLWKYEAGVGWTDLTSGLPFDAQSQTYGGILMLVYVKPDDQDTIFLGTVDLFRSTDGGGSFEVISGTGPNFHPDQTAMTFYPSDPTRMIVGNDGGLYKTNNNVAETKNLSLEWESLNNGYLTTQFYTVAVDHGTPGSEVILGGTQDNGIVFTSSADPEMPWRILFGGDGAFAAITDGGEFFYYAMGATLRILRHSFQDGGEQRTEITPVSGLLGLSRTYIQLDPHDQKVMYLPLQRTLWRNSDLTAIPNQSALVRTDVNWETLANVTDHYITAMGMSEAAPRRLYYAGFLPDLSSRVLYLDNPQEGQPAPVDITGENFPFAPFPPFVGNIAVDPRDSDKVIVVFPSYGVLSIYASEDGGGSWSPVSGTLEENPDGTGSGPSVRWVSILYLNDEPVYLAGTSVGLFSARRLEGMDTKWSPEAQSSIGNVVIDMIDVRQSDGFVA
ncbi:MAG: WD40/YVTN/BNR-like repeat-containing protein, partial [Rhodothermia bacterium]